MYYNVYQKDDSDLHVHMTNEFSGNLHWKSPLNLHPITDLADLSIAAIVKKRNAYVMHKM